MEIAIMIEGQNDLNWDRWNKIVRICEDSGISGLYRSDHFTNSNPPDKDSLELWSSLTWLASNTDRLEFGPLVTPLSFRHPVHTARMAASVDDLSGGRLTLGIGAGWQDREHAAFGFDLLSVPERFARFEEGIQVIQRLLENGAPSTFDGTYYSLREAILLPRPGRPSGPPILIGGNGVKRSLPLAAKYAAEWNGIYLTPDDFAERCRQLDGLLATEGRNPASLKRSLMTGCEFGRNHKEVKELVAARTSGKLQPDELAARGVAVGEPDSLISQLESWERAGVQRIMLQWLALEDTDRLEAMLKHLAAHFYK